jgi:hypothetical protein
MPPILFTIYDTLTESVPLQIFAVSTTLILISLVGLVWARALRLSMLEDIPLNRVEFEHPHIPSLRLIVLQIAALLCICAGFVTTWLFSQEYFYVVATRLGPLLMVSAIGIFSELVSLQMRTYGLSLSLGTALGICTGSVLTFGQGTDLVSLLLVSGAMSVLIVLQLENRKAIRRWSTGAHVCLILATVFWTTFLLH